MLMLTSVGVYLSSLRLRDFHRENTGSAAALGVHVEHDLHRGLPGVVKKLLQNLDHELHRCEVVVDDDDIKIEI